MQKGFTRRPRSDEPSVPVKNYITPRGLERLKDEHRFLLTRERLAVTEVVAWAATVRYWRRLRSRTLRAYSHACEVPYARIKQVLLLVATRNYEKAAIAFGTATAALGIPVGSLLILKKHKVDTVVVDYENERHGRIGLVIQMEKGKGKEIGALLGGPTVSLGTVAAC